MGGLFFAGGALSPDGAPYIRRTADGEALRTITEAEKYFHIIAPRQMGKTSLLKRLGSDLIREGWRCSYVDLSSLTKDVEDSVWYSNLGRLLYRSLTPGSPPALHSQLDLREYLLDSVLVQEGEPLKVALLFDEIGAMFEHPLSDTFFMTLRALYNDRDVYDGTLTVGMVGTVDTDQLVKDEKISPFNISDVIPLDEFTREETYELTERLAGLTLPLDMSTHDYIYSWTSGHPYLTQRLCHTIEWWALQGEIKRVGTEEVDRAVRSTLLNVVERDSNVKHIRNSLADMSETAAGAWQRIIAGEPPLMIEPGVSELYLAGVVRQDASERAVIRNRVYREAAKGVIQVSNTRIFDRLHAELIARFNLEELRTLCARLDVSFEDLDAPGPEGKARELILRLKRNRRMDELVDILGIEEAGSAPTPEPPEDTGETKTSPHGVTPPEISVNLLTRVIPTAYCHHLDEHTFPLVTVTLDNSGHGCANSSLSVTTVIEGYSDSAVCTRHIAHGERLNASLLPVLKPEATATLNEIRRATLRVTIWQESPSRHLLYDESWHIHLLARDTALLGVENFDGTILDLTRYLASWVTPRRLEIERLLRKAAEYHPNKHFIGYQGASTLSDMAAVVRTQVRAIFDALKNDANVIYINSPLSLGADAGRIIQRVRLPTECLQSGGSANCIDGTVLFASLLELASLTPLIVIIPGHAFLGWKVWEDSDVYEFLETTKIGSADFDSSQQSAQASYDKALSHGYFSRSLFDPSGFARLIDVSAARTDGIYPLE